jgi:hypothetical protein
MFALSHVKPKENVTEPSSFYQMIMLPKGVSLLSENEKTSEPTLKRGLPVLV